MLPLAVTAPLAYEANPGVFAGTAPAGSVEVRAFANGRPLHRVHLRSGGRRFSFGPTGLPQRDDRIELRAYSRRGLIARSVVEHVYGLPASAWRSAPARSVDGSVQRALQGLRPDGGAIAGVWLRSLASGRAASWNAGARFPAASTLKLAILVTALARERGDPTASSAWPTYLSLVLDSSNRAANDLLARIGGSVSSGSSAVNATLAAVGGRSTDMAGGYLLEQGERWVRGASDVPPVLDQEQPSFPCCKYTTAHDLGMLVVAIDQAAHGRGPAHRLGLTQRSARVALWLMLHTRYPGLVRPNVRYPVGDKAGWLGRVQHDAAIVFTPRGPLVAVVLTTAGGGVSYTASRSYAGRVLRLGLGL